MAVRISALVLSSVSLKTDKRNSSLTLNLLLFHTKYAVIFLQIRIYIYLDACVTTEYLTKIVEISHSEKPVKSVVHNTW